ARLAALLVPVGPQVVRTRRGPKAFDAKKGFEKLCKHFGVASLDGFGLGQRPEAWAAASAVLGYVEETQRSALAHVRQLSTYEVRGTLLIDAASRRNLDLLRNGVDGRRQGSLVGTIDRTATSMGGRLLSQWMLYPLTDVEVIGRRQEAVGELFASAVLREDLTTVLREVGDLERLVGRLVVGQGSARDVRALGLSLRRVPDLRMLLSTCTSRMLRACADELPDLAAFGEGLVQAIVDEPPAVIRDGGLLRHGFHAELDELNGLRLEGKDAILRMEAEERRRTGIQSLKIKQNSVFGYYIEVTKANLAAVPLDYVRKQTTANAERYITPVLREFEDKVFGAEERALALELALFEELRGQIVQRAEGILATARLVATLDVLLSLARVASDLGWSRPEVNEGRLLRILEGRHPVVERALGREPFVPGDLEVDEERRLVVLTGPNMAGKSTAMRQVALIVILAQMGSFVPAREAVVGVADRVFTRVGAGDDLARGQSTFMVEMSETANILRHATRRSLVLLDEIGRGTSTFDGLAIAWAVAEHLHDQLQCRAIFATHYHELTELAREKTHVQNLTMAVREVGGQVVFLRKLEAGAASRSYGIQVAKLAGVPQPVLARAREVLANLEKAGIDDAGHAVFAKAGRRHRQAQLALGFGPSVSAEGASAASSPVLDELKALDANALTPLEALQLVHRWKASAGA
ncbi:MAG: mismatch repair protein MutS, partial [Pseudomonadota bacterium]